jgi:hypothetical protein
MKTSKDDQTIRSLPVVPWFGARKMARSLAAELQEVSAERDVARKQLETLGALPILQLEARRVELQREIAAQETRLAQEKSEATVALNAAKTELQEARKSIVETQDLVLLQEAGLYQYRHPLTDAVGYEKKLAEIETQKRDMVRKDGGAVLAASDWTVNGSAAEGRKMVREYSKLMLRAFNAEADNLVRWLKPYKLDAALDRLKKVAETIEHLGKTMKIRISPPYYQLRVHELELTSDFLQKQAEQKEAEHEEKERLREERKAQQEIEAERDRLDKERQLHADALKVLVEKGDEVGAAPVREKLAEINRAIDTVNTRAANIRCGYVYIISNIGAFGEKMVKVGLTRRLDPLERIRELSNASVPFKFDVHAMFFSEDAVSIETAIHKRLDKVRVNLVNHRREFFNITPLEVKAHLLEVKAQVGHAADTFTEFTEFPEALEYHQTLNLRSERMPASIGELSDTPAGTLASLHASLSNAPASIAPSKSSIQSPMATPSL